MRSLFTVRCSALPLAFRCAGSVRPGVVVLNEISDAADTGTCGHEGLARMVERGSVDWESVPALARRHGANEGEIRLLLAQGWKLWQQVRDSFPDAQTEVAFEHTDVAVTLTGHMDVYSRSGRIARLGDWKCGRKDANYAEQLLGYAALALMADDTLDAVTAGVLWVRDGEYEHYTLARKDLVAWLNRLDKTVAQWDGVFRPGPHCAHCPRNHECAAANALVRRDVAAINDEALVLQVEDEAALARMAPDEIIDVLGKADQVIRYAERVRAAVRAYAIKHGDIEGTERRLTVVREERRRLDTLVAFPVLEAAGFGDEEMGAVLDFNLSRVEKIVATRAGKGRGAKAVRELRETLQDANAIQTETVAKLVTRRA